MLNWLRSWSGAVANGNGNGNGNSNRYNVMQAVVGLIVIVGLFGVIAAWMLIALFSDATKMDIGITTILTGLTGVVSTIAVQVVGYYFGSSKSSADKDDTAKQVAQTTAKAVENAQATTDRLVEKMAGTGNGNGNGGGDAKRTVINQPESVVVNNQQPTKEQLVAGATAKFVSGEYDEATYRAVLKATEIGLSDAEIDAAVLANKKG